MQSPQRREAAAAAEAAAWHTRLGAESVTTEAITEFYAWRRDPLNDAAYRKVERIWTQAKGLRGRPAIEEAVQGALSRKAKRRRRGAWTGAGGLAVATLIAAVCAGVWLQGRQTYSTPVGGEQVIELADGSFVRLDTASQVTVRYDGDQRLVQLNAGRALFDVVPDGARPFIVRSGTTDVRAVGTVFDVRRVGDGVTVSMVEGVVEVTDRRNTGRPERIGAGQQLRMSAVARRILPIDPVAETGWAENRLVFREMALKDAVAEVNRYLKEPITLGTGVQQTKSVSGVFRTGDRDAFTAAASVLLDLSAVPLADGGVRLEADENNRRDVAGTSR